MLVFFFFFFFGVLAAFYKFHCSSTGLYQNHHTTVATSSRANHRLGIMRKRWKYTTQSDVIIPIPNSMQLLVSILWESGTSSTRYMHLMQSRAHMGSWCWMSGQKQCHGLHDAVLCSAYPVHGPSASEVNRFVAGTQVFSFHCRTVVFHRLTVFAPLDAFSGQASLSLL